MSEHEANQASVYIGAVGLTVPVTASVVVLPGPPTSVEAVSSRTWLATDGSGSFTLTATGPSAGVASMGTIDLYAPSVHWQVLESYGGLAPGSHTIVVTVLGTKNASSAGMLVVMDAFVVYS